MAIAAPIDECLSVADGRLQIEGCDAGGLAERFGTPLSVISEDHVRRNARRFGRALAAGHRPCAECRHADYQSFLTAWTAARALPAKPSADEIDQVLHWERRLAEGARVTYRAMLSELPDGVFVVHDDESWLLNNGSLHRWTPAGYADGIDQFDGPAAVLTPRATVEAIRAGYRPLVHLPS